MTERASKRATIRRTRARSYALPFLTAFYGALLFHTVPASAASNTPASNIPYGVENEQSLRVFARIKDALRSQDLSYFFEYRRSAQTDSRRTGVFTVGPYFRAHENLTVGAFYRRQYGMRYDEDWINDGSWHWADTRSRGENIFIADAIPRVLLDFLPGWSWRGELRARYLWSSFASKQTLALRPGLNYFWLRDGEPFLTFFAQYEMFLPLNYGTRAVTETWEYLGAVYTLNSTFDLGAYGALKHMFWNQTEPFQNRFGRSFEQRADSFVIGLVAIARVEL